MSRSVQRLQQFWVLQIAGWSVYAGGILIGLLPRLRYPDAVAYDLTALFSVFAASFVLRAVCRRSFRRGDGWPWTMFRAGLVSLVCAVPCGVVAEWAAHSARGESFGWLSLARAGGGIVYSTVVLMSWSGLYLGIKHYQLLQTERERAQQAEALARDARLQALRFQLQPHFLFNTLNAISTLIVEGRSTEANLMLGQLANFLRGTLHDSAAPEIPLSKEMANAKEYVAIEKARLGERLEVEFLIAADAEGALVPTLLLQPLVENAIYHGIAPRADGGKLTVTAEREETRLRLRVCDNGAGGAGVRTLRRGVGLANTIERLRVLYGNDQRLAVRWPEEGGCVVDIDLPYATNVAARLYEGETACVS